MNSALRRVIEILLPATCLLCKIDLPSGCPRPVCSGCVADLHTSFQIKIQPSRSLDSLVTCGAFDRKLRDLIHLYKYQGKDYLSRTLLDVLAWRLPFDVDAVTFVPTSWRAEFKRGFNPARMLAEEIAGRSGLRVAKGLLRRQVWGASQTNLSRTARKKNAENGYRTGLLPWRVPQRVLLVDDVYTTGATMERCAFLLRSGGAKAIHGFCLAKDELH